MSALTLVITSAGYARFSAAQGNADIDLTITTIGLSPTAFVAAPTLTALPGESKRLPVSGANVGPGLIHLTAFDSDDSIYEVRGLGLFLADGTLFAAYAQPGLIVQKASGATFGIALDVAFPLDGIDRVAFGDTNFLYPPATTAPQGVMRIATPVQIDAGVSLVDAVTPAGLRRALPIGIVSLWYGSAATVPPGWAICNGAEVERSDGAGNITLPDLRDRVAVGAGAQAQGARFGSATNTADTTLAGGHTPTGKVPDITVTSTRSVTNITVSTTRKTETAGGGSDNTVKTVTLDDPGHTHDVSITSKPELLLNPVADHNHQVTLSTMQPSLALHYIMKV